MTENDSVLVFIDPNTDAKSKFYFREDACYQYDLCFPNQVPANVVKNFIQQGWKQLSHYHFEKDDSFLELEERTSNYLIGTITSK